jgi:hypothetical protein
MQNQVKKERLGARICLKVANMRAAQSFILYPYDGGDKIYIQSSKRFIIVNLNTGKSLINAKNETYPNSVKLWYKNLAFDMPEEALTSLKKYLWDNDGKDGGDCCISYENKKLYANS